MFSYFLPLSSSVFFYIFLPFFFNISGRPLVATMVRNHWLLPSSGRNHSKPRLFIVALSTPSRFPAVSLRRRKLSLPEFRLERACHPSHPAFPSSFRQILPLISSKRASSWGRLWNIFPPFSIHQKAKTSIFCFFRESSNFFFTIRTSMRSSKFCCHRRSAKRGSFYFPPFAELPRAINDCPA